MPTILDTANTLTNGAVRRFIRRRRTQTPPLSYQRIAFDLREQYDIDVTDTTVRQYCLDNDLASDERTD